MPGRLRDTDSFNRIADTLVIDLVAIISDGKSPSERLCAVQIPAMIKSADGLILVTNNAHNDGYGNTVGRNAQDYVDSVTKLISHHSDQLILAGTDRLDLSYAAKDPSGNPAIIRSAKRSLLQCKSQFAILVLYQVIEVLDSVASPARSSLLEAWQALQQMEKRDFDVAVSSALGIPAQTIADKHGVSRKTIENHRSEILETLRVTNTHELMRLLVRIQDNGFADFGL